MEYSILPGTCSMAELYHVDYYDIDALTKSEIRELISRSGSVKVVIYNTNEKMNAYKRFLFWLRTGFKRVYSYNGNISRVDVYIMKL